jgi:FMN-dependent NADH-azoreductase
MLLDFFLEQIKNQNIETIDLLKTPAPIFNEQSIQSYYKRNYNGQKLDETEAKLLEKNDQLIAKLKSADILVMAHPMHNYGIPAAAKAYLDAVIFTGETAKPREKMMKGKKALVLYTSGGMYSENFNFDYPNWNSLLFNYKVNFGYMGYDETEVIGTSLRDEKTRAERLEQMKEKIREVVSRWYK